MTTEKRTGIVDLERLGTVIRAPSVTELHDILHGGRWFSGASIGHEYGFVCREEAGTALTRLIAHFGLPNSPQYQRWDASFLRQRDKSTWEYILLVNGRDLFAVYDYKGGVSVGYRMIALRGACPSSRYDFRADTETCQRFCRYIEAVVNFPPELVK